MENENIVLCGANSYDENYYLNAAFDKMPRQIKDELKILCVLFVHNVGGILLLEFNEEGSLEIRTEALENDFSYDEIGAALKVKELQRTQQELFRSIELYYQVVVLGNKDIQL